MSSDDLDQLNNLLGQDTGAFTLVSAEMLDAAGAIGKTILEAGCGSFGGYINRGVLYTDGEIKHRVPADMISDEITEWAVTPATWTGDRNGELILIVPQLVAKGVVAYLMAMMMGGDADPEGTALDEEGMDAYCEGLNSFFGTASQALRDAVGGTLDVKPGETRLVNTEERTWVDEIGETEILIHQGQIVIEGMHPMPIYLVVSPGVTGVASALEASSGADNAAAAVEEASASQVARIANDQLALYLRIPVRVILAEKRVRMELIQSFSPGSIIEFRKNSGELLDVCAGDVKFAEGEVVITNQHFGVQIRKLVDVRQALS